MFDSKRSYRVKAAAILLCCIHLLKTFALRKVSDLFGLTYPVAISPGTDVMKQAPPSVSAKLRDRSLMDMRLKGGAMDTIYIGVDFHARQQTICYLKTETGELVTC